MKTNKSVRKLKRLFCSSFRIFFLAVFAIILAGGFHCEYSPDTNLIPEVSMVNLLTGVAPGGSGEVTGPKRMFLSNTSTYGNIIGGTFMGIAGADYICNSDANTPTDGSTYKALIVDGINRRACTSSNCNTSGLDEHIDWVLQPNTEYIRLDSAPLFATDTNGIFDFLGGSTLQNPLVTSPLRIFTGLWDYWMTDFAAICDGVLGPWATPEGQFHFGDTSNVDGGFISSGIGNTCSGWSYWLVCVEQ